MLTKFYGMGKQRKMKNLDALSWILLSTLNPQALRRDELTSTK